MVTIGCDPEVFVGENGKFVSAHGMVDGDKNNPLPVKHGAVQVDGMALEFNIDPVDNPEQFEYNIEVVKEQLKEMVGLDFIEACSVEFDEEFFLSTPRIARRLGCEPDYNAWTGEVNPKPKIKTMMRTAGGHVHVGGVDSGQADRLARLMDESVGVYSIFWDKDDKRRSMYGKAGAFRPKEYGMEYRSLSNAWIFSKELIRIVYDWTMEAVDKFNQGLDADPVVRSIIDNSDRGHAFFNGNKKAQLIMEM